MYIIFFIKSFGIVVGFNQYFFISLNLILTSKALGTRMSDAFHLPPVESTFGPEQCSFMFQPVGTSEIKKYKNKVQYFHPSFE